MPSSEHDIMPPPYPALSPRSNPSPVCLLVSAYPVSTSIRVHARVTVLPNGCLSVPSNVP